MLITPVFFTLRIATDYMNEKLKPEVIALFDWADAGWMLRPRASYEFTDHVKATLVTLGADLFGGKAIGFFGQFADNDRLYGEISTHSKLEWIAAWATSLWYARLLTTGTGTLMILATYYLHSGYAMTYSTKHLSVKAADGIDAAENERNADFSVKKVTAPAMMSLLAVLLMSLSQITLANPTAEQLPTLTAEQLVKAAIEKHPDLATFQARLEAAGAQARGSSSERLPRLAVEVGTQHFNNPARIRPATANNQQGEFSRNLWAGDLVLRWTAYSGGRLSAAEEAARLLEQASGSDLRFFQERIATRVAQLYFEFGARRSIIRASEKSLQSLRQQARQVGQLLEQGKAAEVDRMRLDVRAATVEQSVIQQRNDRESLRASINFMVGRPLDDRWESVERVKEPLSSAPEVDPPINDTSTPRSDLQAARLRMESTAATIEQAKAAWSAHCSPSWRGCLYGAALFAPCRGTSLFET